jgi:ArsR family transcriptional regulator
MDAQAFELARRQAETCSLFGNPIRVMIIWLLKQREMSVSDIATTVRASLQNTSQHLRLMKDRGILAARREGNTVLYRLQPHQDIQGCRLLKLAKQIQPWLDELPERPPAKHRR